MRTGFKGAVVTLGMVLAALWLPQAALASHRDQALAIVTRQIAAPGAAITATYDNAELEWSILRDSAATDQEATDRLLQSWPAKAARNITLHLTITATQPIALDWSEVRLQLDFGEELAPLPESYHDLPVTLATGATYEADLVFPRATETLCHQPRLDLLLHKLIPGAGEPSLSWEPPLGFPVELEVALFEAGINSLTSSDSSAGDCH